MRDDGTITSDGEEESLRVRYQAWRARELARLEAQLRAVGGDCVVPNFGARDAPSPSIH